MRWFEVWTTALGFLFLALAVVCVVATVTILLSWGQRESSFPTGEGTLEGLRGFGVVFFPVAALVTFATGWWLTGDRIRSWLRRLRVGDRDEG
jgi:hypothetical protein